MAIINVNFLSESLMRSTDIKVILPIDKILFPGMKPREEKPFKTLYLLHGVLGDNNDWIKGTRIALWAQENNLAVIMPSGENQFYLNQKCPGFAYSDYIGKELVEITRKMFPLSDKREDTFIGGLSMGGYGALYNGILHHNTFGNIVALSSALVTNKAGEVTYDHPIMTENRHYFLRCFGDLDNMSENSVHLQTLVKEKLEEGAKLPDIYMACGRDDFLKGYNDDFAAYLEKNDIKVTYEVGPGDHEWDFWDTYIKKGMDWLPLEQADEGVHSGNISEGRGT